MEKKIVIIGGGLTGLTTAFYLKKQGKNFIVLEKEDTLGGVMKSCFDSGFIYEQGPSSGVMNSPEVLELFEDLEFINQLETAKPTSNKRWIWYKNHWEVLPTGFFSAIKTSLFTWKDKIRILGEPFRSRGTNPNETLAELVRRRLGTSYLDYAVDPFLGGIYAGDPEKIITKYGLPKLYNLEQKYGSFIRGSIKKAKEPKTERDKKTIKAIFNVKGGFSNLIDKLTDEIGRENIVKNVHNLIIQPSGSNYTLTANIKSEQKKWIAQEIITTIPAPYLNEIFDFVDAETLAKITSTRYAPVVQDSVAFDNWEGLKLDAFGGLITSKAKRNLLGVLFPSSIFSDRANKNGALLSVFMGGIRRQDIIELSDDEIKKILETELVELFQLRNYQPKFVKIFRYKYAIPQYEAGSKEKLEAIEKLQKQYKGLYVAGNIRDGIGMGDRIKQGVTVAYKRNTSIR